MNFIAIYSKSRRPDVIIISKSVWLCGSAAGIDASDMMMDDLPPGVDVPVPPLGEMHFCVSEYRLPAMWVCIGKRMKSAGCKELL